MHLTAIIGEVWERPLSCSGLIEDEDEDDDDDDDDDDDNDNDDDDDDGEVGCELMFCKIDDSDLNSTWHVKR